MLSLGGFGRLQLEQGEGSSETRSYSQTPWRLSATDHVVCRETTFPKAKHTVLVVRKDKKKKSQAVGWTNRELALLRLSIRPRRNSRQPFYVVGSPSCKFIGTKFPAQEEKKDRRDPGHIFLFFFFFAAAHPPTKREKTRQPPPQCIPSLRRRPPLRALHRTLSRKSVTRMPSMAVSEDVPALLTLSTTGHDFAWPARCAILASGDITTLQHQLVGNRAAEVLFCHQCVSAE